MFITTQIACNGIKYYKHDHKDYKNILRHQIYCPNLAKVNDRYKVGDSFPSNQLDLVWFTQTMDMSGAKGEILCRKLFARSVLSCNRTYYLYNKAVINHTLFTCNVKNNNVSRGNI